MHHQKRSQNGHPVDDRKDTEFTFNISNGAPIMTIQTPEQHGDRESQKYGERQRMRSVPLQHHDEENRTRRSDQ